jgi:hypothetical protein
MRIFTPMILCSLFFWSLFDDLTREEGFLRSPDGEWILLNCVGLSVMILVPIAAMVVSCAGGRGDMERRNSSEMNLQSKGQLGGIVTLILAGASAVLIGVLFKFAVEGRHERLLLWVSLPLSIAAVMIGNHLLNRHNKSGTRASRFARWGGMIGVIDLGGFIALSLVYSTSEESVHAAHPPQEQLSTVSYVILGAVSLLIICGLGWCFYRALSAANEDAEIQRPDEIGDEEQQTPNE